MIVTEMIVIGMVMVTDGGGDCNDGERWFLVA